MRRDGLPSIGCEQSGLRVVRRLEILIAFLKALDLLFDFILGDAIGFLNLAGQYVAIAGNDIEVIICELAPARGNQAFELLPIAFYNIPIQDLLLIA